MTEKTLAHGNALTRTLNFIAQLLPTIETLIGLEVQHKEQLKQGLLATQAHVQSQFDALSVVDDGRPPMKAVAAPAAEQKPSPEQQPSQGPAQQENPARHIAGDDGG